MIPVLEMSVPSNMSVALFNLDSASQGSWYMSCSEYSYSVIALFVRIENKLLCSSVPSFPPNRANGEAVFEGSPIRYTKI